MSRLIINPYRFGGGAGGTTEWVTGFTPSSTVAPENYSGLKFQVGGSGITVTQLGYYLPATDGYDATTDIEIRASDGTTVVAATTVDLSVNTIGWHWGVLASPVALSASTTYYLCAKAAFQSMHGPGTTVTTTAVASCLDAAFSSAGVMTDEGAGAGHAYGPLNFKY